MICPKCKKEEADEIYGMCERCWELYCDETWWEAVINMDKACALLRGESK